MELVNPQEVLLKFMYKMNLWEVKYYSAFIEAFKTNDGKRGLPDIVRESQKEELESIFSEFLTKKERKFGRLVSLSTSCPPAYDPENDEIVEMEVGNKRAIFVVQKHTGFKNKYRYTLHFKKGEWRIDKKEMSDENDKWARSYL